MLKTIVAFICVHNSCRSQIAEALGNLYLKDNLSAIQQKPILKVISIRMLCVL